MKVSLSLLERIYLGAMIVLLAASVVLSYRLMHGIACFQACKLREAEHDALIRDVEMWLEVQRGRHAETL